MENFLAKLGEVDFVNYIKTFDLFCAIETFSTSQFDSGIHFSEYFCFQTPAVKVSRRGRPSGGIIILVKKSILPFVRRVDCNHDHMICLRFSKALFGLEKDIICTFIYNPPYQSPYYDLYPGTQCQIAKLEEFMLNILQNGEDAFFMVMGDLNARIGEWSLEDEQDQDSDDLSSCRVSEDKITNQFGKALIDFCTLFHLLPLNGFACGDKDGKFTFVANQGNSVIDYVLMFADLFYACNPEFQVDSRVESSHLPICLTMPCQQKCNENAMGKSDKVELKTKVSWNNERKDEYLENIRNETFQNMFQAASELIDSSVELALETFTKTILQAGECMRRRVGHSTVTRMTNRWYDKDCIQKKREARTALKTFQKSGIEADKKEYKRLRTEYKTTINNKKQLYKKSVQESLLLNKKNSSKFWDTIRKARNIKKPQPNIDMNSWKTHFEKVLNDQCENTERVDQPLVPEETVVPELDTQITDQEVKDAIRNLKLGKASGLDEICGEFLKCAEDVVTPFLVVLFNKIYNLGLFPLSWCQSVIVPIFKKGDEGNPDNYRGISLLSIVGKVFTAILNKRLYVWAERENKISPEQAGFRKSYSTVDHIFTLTSIVKSKLNSRRGGKVYAAFIDYRKAFDTVDRNKMWETLEKIKTSTKLITILKSMYSSVSACVRWGGKISDFFDCSQGLKQGCLLSPVIFSLLISEVAEFVRQNGRHGIQLLPGLDEIYSLLFADDIVLLASSPNGLQNQIKNLELASKSLGLTVNLDKTKVMIFRKGGFISAKEKWLFDGKVLEVVNKYKYLGYTLTTKLSENIACEEYAIKAKGKVLDILKTMWALGNLNTKVFFHLFDAQVKPMLLYAAEVWGLCKLDIVESAHLFACKRLLCVSDKTPNSMVYGETGRYPLNVDATISCIRYWLKLCKMANTRIPNQAMHMLKNTMTLNGTTTNWVSKVKVCLETYGFQDVWENQGTIHETAFLKSLKQKLVDKFKEEWLVKLQSSDRFAMYNSFKLAFGAEDYLNELTIKRFRDTLIRFRLGLNELGINKRYQNADVNRCCPFCPNILEDEYHFLFVCPAYEEIRNKYIKDYLNENANVLSFMQNSCHVLKRKCAMYLYYSLKHREEMM